MNVALSLFPGLGVLDLAFDYYGWCVLRGPDVVYQSDIRGFQAPSGVFDGVFGGPPCQEFSKLRALGQTQGHTPSFGNLIPEFERVVGEASPRWFLMENVRAAPVPVVAGYDVFPHLVRDYEVGGTQLRERVFSLGLRTGAWSSIHSPWSSLTFEITPQSKRRPVVYGSAGGAHKPDSTFGAAMKTRLSVPDMLEAQGLPRDYLDHAPYTAAAKRKLVGNAVPLTMGKSVAAVVKALTG